MNKKSNDPIIFIGTGRSGSTYISGCIFSHKKIGYPSNYQEKFPANLSINYIKHLFDNSFWRINTRGSFNKFIAKTFFLPSEAYSMWRYLLQGEVDFSRSFLIKDRLTEKTSKRVEEYFQRMIHIQGKERLGFKVTGPSRIGFLKSIFPNAHFVWVKRDLHATISSFLKKDFWKTRGYSDLWFYDAFTNEEKEFALRYKKDPAMLTTIQLKKIMLETEKEIAQCGAKVFEIDYEHFLENPKDSISKILEFSNLDFDQSCFDYISQNTIKKRDVDYRSIFGDEKFNEIEEFITSDKLGKLK